MIVARVPLANPEQAAAWDGSEGEHWTAQADRYDAASRRYDPHLLAAAEITATSAVLDVGCGAGVSSRDAARIALDGRILGIDLSSSLVEEARRRSGGLPNAAFVTGDAQVHAFPESAFDVAISRFGAMFFTDPVAGFANIARALRPGGRLALLAWRELERNPWVAEIRAALAAGRALPEPVPGTPGPFGLADPGAARAWLTEAGYVDVELSEVREPMYLGANTEDAFSFVRGLGLARGLLAGLPGPAAQEALDILRKRLAAHATPDGVLLGSSAWLITGRSTAGAAP